MSEEQAPAVRHLRPLGVGWPNLVSAARILVLPIIVWLILKPGDASDWLAVGVFVLAALSDGVDGYLARRHSMKTTMGAWLDPLSDKFLVLVPAFILAAMEPSRFPWWAAMLILVREVAVQALRWRLDARAISMPASKVAKFKTVSQLFAVGLAMAPLPSGFDGLVLVVTVVAVVLTVYSGIEYFLTSRHRVGSAT